MDSGVYEPMKSVATISNAMDVGDPSNFIRIREIFKNDFERLKALISSYSFTDDQTRDAMLQVYQSTGYVMDPHGAVGYLGLKEYLRQNPGQQGVFLETAHPVKFLEVVEPVLGIKIEYPEQIRAVIDRKKEAAFIRTYGELKEFLTS